MVVIGIDAHKKTFTAVAVDELGRQLGHRTLESTSDGCFQLVRWAAQWRDRRFAVEDCRHLTRRLESDLLTAGESLVRVHTQLMAGERRGGRERGKYGPDQGPWKSIEEVELATLSWVHWYNTERLHGYLGDIPPAEAEEAHYGQLATTR